MSVALNSPTASRPPSIFTNVFLFVAMSFAIRVTSDPLTNLYELTTWLIHSMRRNQLEMHLQKHCTRAAGTRPQRTKVHKTFSTKMCFYQTKRIGVSGGTVVSRLFAGSGPYGDFGLGFVLEGGATEAPESGQRPAGEDRPQYCVCPRPIVLAAKAGEVPEGKGPHDNHVDPNYDHHGGHADCDRHHACRQAFKQQHAPVLMGGIGFRDRARTRSWD